MSSFNLNYLFKGPAPKYSLNSEALGVRNSTYGVGDTIQLTTSHFMMKKMKVKKGKGFFKGHGPLNLKSGSLGSSLEF